MDVGDAKHHDQQLIFSDYQYDAYVQAGGLLSYGYRIDLLYKRGAHLPDRILRGANPADLPVEKLTEFELVVNLKAAKALGLNLPEALIMRADQVIE